MLMNERRRPPTIIDVATDAGVAIGTVSRYLNGLEVRRGNRDAIEAAIQRLGYRRNALAAAVKSDRSNTVGFMVPTLSEFHAPILQQLSSRLHESSRAVLFYCHDDKPRQLRDAIDFFATHRVDCLVLDGNEEAILGIRELSARGTRIILYNNDIVGPIAGRVLVENRRASARAVSYLIDNGHTRVAILVGSSTNYTGRERLKGYLQAMAEHGLGVPTDYVVDGALTEREEYAAIRRLLSLKVPPTAIFSCSYNMTIGALPLLRERGYRIPDDISIVSFDDAPLFRLHEPGITVVAQPLDKIAETIFSLLTSMFSNDGAYSSDTITLDCDIVLRGSSASLRR